MAERAEPATPKRQREAREKGQVARSEDLTAGLVLMAGAGVLAWLGPPGALRLSSFTATLLGTIGARPIAPALALGASLQEAALIVVPPLVALAAVGGAITLAQVGPLFSLRVLEPKLERVNALEGMRRWWSGRTLFALVKGLVKLVVVGWVLYGALSSVLGSWAPRLDGRPAWLGPVVLDSVIGLLLRGGAALLALGLVDLLYQRHRLAKDLRMTREEVKREHKEAEGDGQHKAERQRLHREIIAHSRLLDVRNADCVIVNPDHIAVAIRFDEETMEAPQVVAKGERIVARQIIDIARAHGVPIVRDVSLARALQQLDIDDVIPEELYDAVAEVLRYAYTEREANP